MALGREVEVVGIEHPQLGWPQQAAKSALVSAVDAYIKQNNKYTKNEAKITFNDIADSLILVTNCFSTVVSYENQTKKAITNKFI